MKFVDEVKISVASGSGGQGCVSFRRESHVPRGGPDGGDGGRGGHVIFQVNPQLSSLLDLRYKRTYHAGHGQPGKNSLMTGSDGKNLVLQVPKGNLIRDEKGTLVIDMAGQKEYVFLKGGTWWQGKYFL